MSLKALFHRKGAENSNVSIDFLLTFGPHAGGLTEGRTRPGWPRPSPQGRVHGVPEGNPPAWASMGRQIFRLCALCVFAVKKKYSSLPWIMVGLAGLMVTGCTSLPESMPRHNPAFAPIPPRYQSRPLHPTGSIYQANQDMRLFENISARRVGDILTIRLVEATKASKDADMQIKKGNSISASAPILFGQAKTLGIEWESKATTDKNFKGKGATNQSNQLKGNVTVTVVEVLPNGNLRVQGEKRITINDGHEYVRLAGIVRPVDVAADNSVPSTLVADATIMYTGEGAMADVKEVGWLTRFFNSLFFPF